MKTLFIFSLIILASNAFAASKVNLQNDYDTLGDNTAVVQRAQALDPQNRYKVVQSRTVDRSLRFELGVNAGLVGGGDSYYSTQNLGANFDFHITNHWSIGARYEHAFNQLTAEGQSIFDNAQQRSLSSSQYGTVGIDYPIDTTLGVVNWYPLYGKLNFFDMGVTHFDLYTQLGYGKTTLSSGASDTLAAGGGIGFWWTQHFTTRIEVRYQTYNDHPNFDSTNSSTRQINEVVGTAGMGFLL